MFISHREFRRMLWRVMPGEPAPPEEVPAGVARIDLSPPGRHCSMSKPLYPLGTADLAEEDSQRQLRRARRRMCITPPPRLLRFVNDPEPLANRT